MKANLVISVLFFILTNQSFAFDDSCFDAVAAGTNKKHCQQQCRTMMWTVSDNAGYAQMVCTNYQYKKVKKAVDVSQSLRIEFEPVLRIVTNYTTAVVDCTFGKVSQNKDLDPDQALFSCTKPQ